MAADNPIIPQKHRGQHTRDQLLFLHNDYFELRRQQQQQQRDWWVQSWLEAKQTNKENNLTENIPDVVFKAFPVSRVFRVLV